MIVWPVRWRLGPPGRRATVRPALRRPESSPVLIAKGTAVAMPSPVIHPESLVFRYGADMAPETIVGQTPGARFVARAYVARSALGRLAPAAVDAGDDDPVWGILLIQPESPATSGEADATTDEGRVTHVAILTGSPELADQSAVVRQARFWELSPRYVASLVHDEPSGGEVGTGEASGVPGPDASSAAG